MNQDFEEPDDWKGLAWDKVIEARNDERRKTIEQCAKIAERWFGNTIGKISFGPSPQDAIAAEIRALASSIPSKERE